MGERDPPLSHRKLMIGPGACRQYTQSKTSLLMEIYTEMIQFVCFLTEVVCNEGKTTPPTMCLVPFTGYKTKTIS